MKGLALISIVFVLSTQVLWARSPHMSGKGHHRCHKPKARDCSRTYDIKSLQDLERYKEQTLLTGLEKDLRIRNSLEAQNLLIETSCEIKLHPHVTLKGHQTLKLIAKNIETTAHNTLSGGDVILSSQKDFKLTSHSKLEATRLYLSSEKEIELKNPSSIKATLAILTARKCKIHKRADVQITEKLGRCYGQNDYKISFVGAPLEGEIHLPVTFNTSGSFGLFDRIEYVFGDSETLETMSSEVTKHYEAAGEFQALARFYVNNTAVESEKLTIKARAPVQTDFDIIYGITRTRPPQLIAYADKVPNLPNGVKEYIWDFGDSNTTTVNFLFDNFGTIFHDYQAEGVYKLSLKAKDQTNFVTAPVEKFIDTVNPTIPSPRYRISSFKGAPPFTVEVEALELTDPDGDSLEYQWRFTDTGQTIPYGNQRIVQHTFEREGIFQVQLFVRDSKLGYRGIPIPIYVGENFSVPSLPPVAVVDTTQRNGAAPLTVEFSSTRSFDPDGVQGQAMSYVWSFFDQTLNRNVQIFSQNLSYTFQRPGAYYPVLTITDVTGQRTSFRVPIFVEGEQLQGLSFLVRPTGSPRSFDISALDMLVANGYIGDSMQWDFGDNTFFFGPNTIKTYQNPGSYTVKLKARKINGPYEEFTRTLVVEETPIAQSSFIATKTRFNPNEPQEIEATLTNPLSDPEQVLYQWTLSSGLKVAGLGSAFKKITPIFTDRNPVQVTLYTQFPNGFSNLARYTIQANQAPVISGITVYGAGDSAPVRIGAAPYEQAYDPDDFIKEYIYEWGDGSPILRTRNGYEEHTYQEAGSYTLKVTVIDDFGATASFSKLLEIRQNQKPIAGLTRIGQDLTAPTNVGFDAYQLSYDPDGFITEFEFSSQGQTILSAQGYQEFSYQNAGSYQVSLRVKDNKGVWSDPTSLNLEITANLLPRVLARVDLIELVAPGRIGVELGESRDDDGWIEEFEFDFGDSTFIRQTASYLAHTYTNPGVYTFKARVRDNKGAWSDYFSQTISIVENQKPIAGFTIFASDTIAPAQVGFEAWRLSKDIDGFVANFEYSFGDGEVLTTHEGFVQHTYQNAGSYIVSLRVQDNKGLWSLPFTQTINILENQMPIAGYTIDKQDDIAPVQIGIEAWRLSKDNDGFIVNFEYSFGDGEVLTTPSGFVQHTYKNAGSYNLSVRVQDNEGRWSEPSFQTLVLKENKKPIARIKLFPIDLIAPGKIGINGYELSTDADGDIYAFEYNLGEGTIFQTTESYIEHSYPVAGTYVVRLKVQDNKGAWSDYVTQEVVIKDNVSPFANATINYIESIAPAKIGIEAWRLSTDSDGFITEYEFDFGQGDVQLTSNGYIEKDYPIAGTYYVSLRVKDNENAWSQPKVLEVVIIENKKPLASLVVNPESLIAPAIVNVDIVGSRDEDGFITDYEISFGDGVTFTTQNAGELIQKHTYTTAGNYTIASRVKDNKGAWSEVVSQQIEIKANQLPSVAFTINRTGEIAPATVYIDASGSSDVDGFIKEYIFDLGDGTIKKGIESFIEHRYEVAGVYALKITAIDDKGGESTKTSSLSFIPNMLPMPVLSLFPNIITYTGLEITASALGSVDLDGYIVDYMVDWGDGQVTAGEQSSHVYEVGGSYQVKLLVRDNLGGIAETYQYLSVLDNNAPIASFTISPEIKKRYDILTFDASNSVDSDGTINNYEWVFSDGDVKNGIMVPKFFREVGEYTAKLTVTDNVGAKTEKIIAFDVLENPEILPVPVISMNSNQQNEVYVQLVADGLRSTSSTSVIEKYEWDWGDGTYSEGAQASHSYGENGEYRVTLKVTDGLGISISTSTDIIFKHIEKEEEPISNASLSLAGIDLQGFNPRTPTVRIEITNETFGELVDLRLNDQLISYNDFTQSEILLSSLQLLDGKNVLKVVAKDSRGIEFEEEFVIYGGSRNIQVQSSIMGEVVKGNLHWGDDENFKQTRETVNGVMEFENIPSGYTVLVGHSGHSLGVELVNPERNSLSINLDGLSSVYSLNPDDNSSLDGWKIIGGELDTVEFQNIPMIQMRPTDTLRSVFTRTVKTKNTLPHLSATRLVNQISDDHYYVSVVRSLSGELSYGVENAASLKTKYGSVAQSLNDIFIKVQNEELAEVSHVILKKEKKLNVKDSNSFFKAYAQTNDMTVIGTAIEGSVKFDNINSYSVNYVGKSSSVRQYSLNKNSFAPIGSNAMLRLYGELDKSVSGVEIVGVGYLQGTDSITSPTAFYSVASGDENLADCVVRNPNEPAINKSCLGIRFTNSDLVSENNLNTIKANFLFQVQNRDLASERGRLALYYRYNGKLYKTNIDQEISPFVKFQNATRFTRNSDADVDPIGGDKWGTPFVVKSLNRNNFVVNDISTQGGGFFHPHKDHRTGLDIDGKFQKYNYQTDDLFPTVTGVNPKGAACNGVNVKQSGYVKIDFDFLEKLKESLGDESLNLQKIIFNPYVLEPDLSTAPEIVKKSLYCEKNDVGTVERYSFKEISLSSRMLLRQDFQEDFNRLRKRTCLNGITLEELTKGSDPSLAFNSTMTSRGHEHHLHLSYLDSAQKGADRVNALSRINLNPDFSTEVDVFSDSIVLKVKPADREINHFDIFYLDNKNKEQRLVQLSYQDGTHEVDNICSDSSLKENGVYVSDAKVCGDFEWLNFYFEDGYFKAWIPKEKLASQEVINKINNLKIRKVVTSGIYCSESTKLLYQKQCPDSEREYFHPNGGGIVDERAYVNPGAEIQSGARICGNVEIDDNRTKVFGKVLINGNVKIKSVAHLYGDESSGLTIDSLDNGTVLINANCNYDSSVPDKCRVDINGTGNTIRGNVYISSSVGFFNGVTLNGFHGNIDNPDLTKAFILFDGNCPDKTFFSNSIIGGNTRIANCVGINDGIVFDSELSGGVDKGPLGINNSIFLSGFAQVWNSTLENNILITKNSFIQKSTVYGSPHVPHCCSGNGFTALIFDNYSRTVDSKVRDNLRVDGVIERSEVNVFSTFGNRGWIRSGATLRDGKMYGNSQLYPGVWSGIIRDGYCLNGTCQKWDGSPMDTSDQPLQ